VTINRVERECNEKNIMDRVERIAIGKSIYEEEGFKIS
jgi:hypothetical protein